MMNSPAGPPADVIDELNFVIAERRATINRIKRERKETEAIKAIRIGICEKMIARTMAAREIVRLHPELLEALQAVVAVYAMNNAEPAELVAALRHQIVGASAAIAKAEARG